MIAHPTETPQDARRLLVISYHFGVEGSVGGLRWGGLAKYLSRLGWAVAVVTGAPAPGRQLAAGVQVMHCPRLPTSYHTLRQLRRRLFRRSPEWSRDGAGAARPPGPLSRELVALLTFPDEGRGWILRAAWHTRRLVRRFRPQVVVSSGPPHSAHLVARMALVGTSVPWWLDLRDPWAGPLPKIWQSVPHIGSTIARVVSPVLERRAFRAAGGVIANTHQLAAELAERYPDVPVACVPNGVDPECLPPPAGQRYPGLGVAHAGTLYAGRDLGPVLRALGTFLQRHPEAAQAGSKLRLAGGADPHHARAFYQALAASGMEPYVEVLGPLPRAQALEVVSRSRLALVLAQQQELQIPAKLYESVAMGVPTLVVAPPDSATAAEGCRIGAVVRDSDDVEGIAGVFEQSWRNGSRTPPPPLGSITYPAIARLVDQLLSDAPRAGLPLARESGRPHQDEDVEDRPRDGSGRVRPADRRRRRDPSHR